MNGKPQDSLKRTFGLITGISLVVGMVIGSGVFKKIIPMAQTGLSENAILLAWAAAGFVSLLGAFTVGGLASVTEESGGTYEYFRLAFGKFVSFVSGWTDFMVTGTGANAALAFLLAQTINQIVPLPNPLHAWSDISIAGFIFPFAYSGIKITGIFILIILTGINCLGSRESGTLNNILTSLKIIGILALIFLGLTYSGSEVPTSHDGTQMANAPEGFLFLSAFLAAMLGALWGYDGWVYTSNVAGEIINPRRNVALALAFGLLIIMSLYVLSNYSYMKVIPLEQFRAMGENEIGAAVAAEKVLGTYGRLALLVLIVICVLSAINGNVISIPRKYFRMAQEGYFFRSAATVHPKFKTPHIAMIYCTAWSCLLLLSGSFDMLTNMVIFTSFLFFGLLPIALIKLKRNGTIKHKVWGYPLIPITFLIFSIVFTINTIWVQPKQSAAGLLLIVTSLPFYFYFRKRTA